MNCVFVEISATDKFARFIANFMLQQLNQTDGGDDSFKIIMSILRKSEPDEKYLQKTVTKTYTLFAEEHRNKVCIDRGANCFEKFVF